MIDSEFLSLNKKYFPCSLHIFYILMRTLLAQDDGQQAPSFNPQSNPSDFQSQSKTGKSNWMLIGGGVIMIILCLKVYHLSQRIEKDQQKEEKLVALMSQIVSAKNSLKEIVAQEQSIVIKYENRTKSDQARSKVTADYVYSLAKEQHYLKKIAFMKEMAQSQDFFKNHDKANVSYLLAMNNYKMIHENIFIKREIENLLRTEYNRLSKEHDFSLPQQSFCIVVPTINNDQDFRYQYNLQSIYNQNYTNYKIVIIDDASKDKTFELTQNFIEEHPIPQAIYLIKNKERVSALPNIYKAATQYCAPDDILALVDGDDELLGVNVLKVFNSMYTKHGLEVLYSNIIINSKRGRSVRRGWSSGYTDNEKKFSKYRQESTRMFPLRTFRVSTFLKIPVTDLQSNSGEFFKSAYDQTICPQVLELSCGRNMYIDEFNYLYNVGLGNNDLEVDPELNYRIMHEVRYKRKKHECSTN